MPSNPSLDEMYDDLRQAHEMGETELATTIAGRIKAAQQPQQAQPDQGLGEKLAGYGKAAVSALNAGIASPFQKYEEANRGLRSALGIPDVPGIQDTNFNKMRDIQAEQQHPVLSQFMQGTGTLPYTMMMPGSGMAGAGLQGATTNALLSNNPTVGGRVADTAFGGLTGMFAGLLPKALWGGENAISSIAQKTPGWLANTLEKLSARKQFEGLRLPNSAVNLMHEQLQTPTGEVAVPAGRALRGLTEPITGEPIVPASGDPSVAIKRLESLENTRGSEIGDTISKVDQVAPNRAIDIDGLMKKAEGQVPSGIVEDVLYGGRSANRAKTMLGRLGQWFEGIGKEPEPVQGELGLPGQQLQPGPEVTNPPPVAHSQNVGWQQSLPLTTESLQPGPESIPGGPPWHSGTPSLGQSVAAQREMFPSGPITPVPGEVNTIQPPPIAQSVARQGELFAGNRMPEPEVEHRATAKELWDFTRGLSDRIFNKASERYPGLDRGALLERVKTDPDLAFMWRLRSLASDELESAVATHRPDLLPQFLKSKEEFGTAQTFKPWLTDLFNAKESGRSAVSSKAAYRHLLYGTLAGVGGGAVGGTGGAIAGAALGAMGGEKLHNLIESRSDPFLARTLYGLSQRLPSLSSSPAAEAAPVGAMLRRALLIQSLRGGGQNAQGQ